MFSSTNYPLLTRVTQSLSAHLREERSLPQCENTDVLLLIYLHPYDFLLIFFNKNALYESYIGS